MIFFKAKASNWLVCACNETTYRYCLLVDHFITELDLHDFIGTMQVPNLAGIGKGRLFARLALLVFHHIRHCIFFISGAKLAEHLRFVNVLGECPGRC